MRKRACRLVGRMSMLHCQVWLTSSLTSQVPGRDPLTEGSVRAAGRSLPDMSLAFALLAAINGSTGSCATLSHGLSLPHQALADVSPAAADILIRHRWQR
jgi:hypothetical protein